MKDWDDIRKDFPAVKDLLTGALFVPNASLGSCEVEQGQTVVG